MNMQTAIDLAIRWLHVQAQIAGPTTAQVRAHSGRTWLIELCSEQLLAPVCVLVDVHGAVTALSAGWPLTQPVDADVELEEFVVGLA